MPRPRPPHLHRETTRHGRTVWYVRIDRGPRIRIKAAFGTPEFDSEYQDAIKGNPRQRKGSPGVGTLAWLIARYKETTDWSVLSRATRRQRDNIFKHVIESAGRESHSKITATTIAAGRDRRAAKPAAARHFIVAMRGVFRWALQAGYVKTDPTSSVAPPRRKKNDGFMKWEEDHVAAYEKRWPIGTRERVWLDVLLYTGLRRGDAVRLGRQHVRDGIATLRTEKSGFTVEVNLPILPVLQATLSAGPVGDLAFIVGANGKPLKKESFGNQFRDACRLAGVPGSAHGVRKIAATRMADNGATEAQLESIFGWSGGGMAALYTRKANRKKLAESSMHLIANKQ